MTTTENSTTTTAPPAPVLNGLRRPTAAWLAIGGLALSLIYATFATTALAWLISIVLATRWRQPGILRQCAVIGVVITAAVVLMFMFVDWQTRYHYVGCFGAVHSANCETVIHNG